MYRKEFICFYNTINAIHEIIKYDCVLILGIKITDY